MSFIAVQVPSGRPTVIPGSSSVSNSPANARSKSASSPSGSSVARKPTSPKLTANTGTPVPAYSRSAVRIVPSPPITTQRSTSRASGASTTMPAPAASPCLRVSLGVEAQRHAGALRRGDQRGQRRRGVGGAPVREHGGDAGHGSTSRTAASRSSSARRPRPARRTSRGCRPARAARTTRSRARTRRGARAAAATPSSASRRSAGSRTTPPLPTRSRPTSNCGLTITSASNRVRRARQHRRQHLRQRDERDVGDDQVRPVRQRAALERARVDPLEHRDARIVAQRQRQLPVGDVERDHVRGARAAAGSR